MTSKEFLKKVSHGKEDFLQAFLDLLAKKKISYCVIGGLAVNAYVEPVVSLDLDIVIVSEKLEELIQELKKRYKVETFPHSINVFAKTSELRIQIQKDPRYQDFLKRAQRKDVLGYKIPVACVEDVLQGKIWAAQDNARRPSKRQKDMADILRLMESDQKLASLVPEELKKSWKM